MDQAYRKAISRYEDALDLLPPSDKDFKIIQSKADEAEYGIILKDPSGDSKIASFNEAFLDFVEDRDEVELALEGVAAVVSGEWVPFAVAAALHYGISQRTN